MSTLPNDGRWHQYANVNGREYIDGRRVRRTLAGILRALTRLVDPAPHDIRVTED